MPFKTCWLGGWGAGRPGRVWHQLCAGTASSELREHGTTCKSACKAALTQSFLQCRPGRERLQEPGQSEQGLSASAKHAGMGGPAMAARPQLQGPVFCPRCWAGATSRGCSLQMGAGSLHLPGCGSRVTPVHPFLAFVPLQSHPHAQHRHSSGEMQATGDLPPQTLAKVLPPRGGLWATEPGGWAPPGERSQELICAGFKSLPCAPHLCSADSLASKTAFSAWMSVATPEMR